MSNIFNSASYDKRKPYFRAFFAQNTKLLEPRKAPLQDNVLLFVKNTERTNQMDNIPDLSIEPYTNLDMSIKAPDKTDVSLKNEIFLNEIPTYVVQREKDKNLNIEQELSDCSEMTTTSITEPPKIDSNLSIVKQTECSDDNNLGEISKEILVNPFKRKKKFTIFNYSKKLKR